MFNLSAIVGSALLYGDFKKATFHQLVTFLYGCGATFAGVFLIAWSPSPHPSPSDGESAGDIGGEEEDDDGYDTHTLPGTSAGGATPAGGSAAPSLRTLGKAHGSLPRRRATLVVPEGGGDAVPVLRTRHSVLGLYGFSPAQVSPSPCLLITYPSSLTDPIPISPRDLRVLS